MRPPIHLLSTCLLVAVVAIAPSYAVKRENKPTVCPYLNQNQDENTASTEATYDAASKTLNIRVSRSVPDVFWPIAESMTKDRVTKIMQQCPTINLVKVNFQSGQTMSVKRPTTAVK